MTGTLPLHVAVDEFEVRDNCLCAGDKKLTDLAAELGQTPFYVYDSRKIQRRLAKLRADLPERIHLHYAIKANPMSDVVNLISPLVDGLDVASAGELAVALGSNCNPGDISFAGPGKTTEELRRALAADITINIESRAELERILALRQNAAQPARIAVRVNPDFELKTSGMKMSGGAKPFGIDAEQVPDLLRDMKQMPVDFIGFHIFCGSQNLRAEAICEAQSLSLDLALELAEFAPAAPASINIGGGFGIPYFPGDEPLQLNPVAANLSVLLQRLEEKLPQANLVLELGRYIVAEAGLYVCRVIERKVSRGQVFLVTDGGLHHHLAASGNFGQILRKNYPVLVANRVDAETTEVASVVGPLCTPLDLLADKMTLARAEVGDLIAVFQSGAYGFTASPQGFLSHPPPLEVLV